jgi:hypothetical protein
MTTLTLDISPEPRPSLLDRIIDERRRGDCTTPPRRSRESVPAREPARVAGDGERSLDELVSTTWIALTAADAAAAAACFVCGGDLAARYGAGARPVGGRCRDCGSELS